MIIQIIGVGHIGGSLAISLRENGFASKVIGSDLDAAALDKALRRRIIDEACSWKDGLSQADICILAVPVDAILKLLPQVLDLVDQQTVVDVGSTKEQILNLVDQHPNRGRFVATHPMAGTEYSGVEAAIPNLFDHKHTVICEVEKSEPDAQEKVADMYRSIPMKMVFLDRKAHDLHAAYVSHISHISSFALALTVLEKERDEERIFELASSGFGSTVRLAKSSPDMWIPIFRQNRDHVLDVLDEHINTLAKFRSLLIKQEFDTFYKLIEEANRIRKILE
ncbi:MAG: prephenate dehydrogenase [Saprospiraceae bacterium]|nr:prephenate dehydrogenase [Saprospiraceae bacterium]